MDQSSITYNNLLVQVRMARNELLKSTDWTQGADNKSVLTDEEIAAYAQYRQTLRDITKLYDLVEAQRLATPIPQDIIVMAAPLHAARFAEKFAAQQPITAPA